MSLTFGSARSAGSSCAPGNQHLGEADVARDDAKWGKAARGYEAAIIGQMKVDLGAVIQFANGGNGGFVREGRRSEASAHTSGER